MGVDKDRLRKLLEKSNEVATSNGVPFEWWWYTPPRELVSPPPVIIKGKGKKGEPAKEEPPAEPPAKVRAGYGKVPLHYKRCSITSVRERMRYAMKGARTIWAYYGTPTFFTQSLIAGVCLSGDFDKIGIIASSQYGKSFLMGRIALALAFHGHKVNIAGATTDLTDKIMRHCLSCAAEARPEIKSALSSENLKKIDKLDSAMSKTRLSFPGNGKGQVQALTLGDTFSDNVTHNKAVGESGAWIVDEAALVSETAMAEIGRREFSALSDEIEPLIMISNPHNPGYFYDFMTTPDEELGERECIIWADALTIAQEERRSPERILASEFAKVPDTLQRYLLCELPTAGSGMFGEIKTRKNPKVFGDDVYTAVVLGVDSAYKGKDYIEIAQCVIEPGGLYIPAVEKIEKTEWIDGVTSQDIIEHISKIYHSLGAVMCCVDEGWGVWLKEGLVLHGVNAKGIQFGGSPTEWRRKDKQYSAMNASRKRDEMHLDLAELIDSGVIEFGEQAAKEIQESLPMVTSSRKSNGKIQVIPKAEIKAKLGHSPDALDAVLLAVHAAILYNDTGYAYITEGYDANY